MERNLPEEVKGKISLSALLLVSVLSGGGQAAERWRLVSIPLDMPLSDAQALDNQALEGLYQGDYGTHMPHNYGGYIGENLRSSVLNESPFYHIDTTLKDGRDFELWFSSAEDGRKVFGMRLNIPYSDTRSKLLKDAAAEVEAAFGKADLDLSPPDMPTQRILVIADRTMPKDRYRTVLARLPKADKIGREALDSFWNAELAQFAALLGPDFRGVIVVLNADPKSGKLVSGSAQLLDLARARTVFNLGPAK
jgi:hypothetical protein